MLYDKVLEILSSLKSFAHSTMLDLLQYLPQNSDSNNNATNNNNSEPDSSPSFARSASEAAASVFLSRKSSKKE